MESFSKIIEDWPGGIAGFAAAIGVAYGTAQVMKHRDSIKSDYWADLVEAAQKVGKAHITHEYLSELKKQKRQVLAGNDLHAA